VVFLFILEINHHIQVRCKNTTFNLILYDNDQKKISIDLFFDYKLSFGRAVPSREAFRRKARKDGRRCGRCRKKATGGSSFCGFASTRLPAADLEPDAGGEADTPKESK